jgi:catechol 2,3-dioxygenase-like lactoylglutathione lyase family enzyme
MVILPYCTGFCAANGEIGGANGEARTPSGNLIPATIRLPPHQPIGRLGGMRGDNSMRLSAVVPPAALLAIFSVGFCAGFRASPSPVQSATVASPANPDLINTCLITSDLDRLVAFYEPILGIRADRTGPDYAEFHTGTGVLAIFSQKAEQHYIPGSAIAASNRSLVLEFRVGDVDAEYTRLQKLVQTWVKPPTTQPWGTRSFYFRDPDGNLVDFFTPAPAH